MQPGTPILIPTAYFPPISYFMWLVNARTAYIELWETYPKQTYRNRCEILTSAGKLNLVVPVSKPGGNHTPTKDIQISYREPWNRHHWKSITTAYRSSPYFEYYADTIKPLFESKETSLLIHNHNILYSICKILKVRIATGLTEIYIKQPKGMVDLRGAMKPGEHAHGFSFTEYPQVFSHISGFVPNLSILDVLFNLGPETSGYLRELNPMMTGINTEEGPAVI